MNFDYRYRPKQTRELESELRHMIDEAIAAGRVTVVAVGVTGLLPLVWDSKMKQLVQAVKEEPNRDEFKKARRARNTKRTEAAEARRAEVLKMVEDGMSFEDVARARGETLVAVKEVYKKARRFRRLAQQSGDEQ